MKIAMMMLLGLLAVGPTCARPKLEGVADLKEVQAKVIEVTRKATPATVLILSPETGGSGSGVVVSKDGLVLTAAHVVENAKTVSVVFPDGTESQGTVLGANYSRDAAMVRLPEGREWPFAEPGDSKKLAVGDFVVAMGHPKGYDPTRRPPVRFGRVMTKGRLGFVTTDCTLIGGDSGGPLFDLEGKVVAIHSNIAPDREVNNHAGIESYQRDWARLEKGDEWGSLGAFQLEREDRPVMGVVLGAEEEGLVVQSVVAGSPAAQAGLQPGDVLKKAEGQEVATMDDYFEATSDLSAGDVVKLVIARGEERLEKEVTLAARGRLR